MTTATLGRLVVGGLESVQHLGLEITTDVTVPSGANGAGKSNVVGALELISRIWDDSFQQQITDQGGMSSLVFEGRDAQVEHASIEIHGTPNNEDCVSGYRVELRAADDDTAALTESLLFHDRQHYDRPYDQRLGTGASSKARRVAEESGDQKLRNFAGYITSLVSGCRVFHFDDVSVSVSVKGWSIVGDDVACARTRATSPPTSCASATNTRSTTDGSSAPLDVILARCPVLAARTSKSSNISAASSVTYEQSGAIFPHD